MRMTDYRDTLYACARKGIAALALLLCLFVPAALAETDGMLRVKLARLGTPSEIVLRANCDYYLASDPSTRIPEGAEVTVRAEGGELTLSAGGRAISPGASVKLMRAVSGSRGVQFITPALSNRFCGDLCFTAAGDGITTLLRIYVEDYLCGVVGNEMPPSSDPEALKAQAVVARNYALRQKAARSGAACDLFDTGDALSYRGYSAADEYKNVLRAVDDTRGQVLCYGDGPAVCYFCDSNGGQTESAANALGDALPYSVVVDDPYDLESTGAKRVASLRRDASELHPSLREALLAGVAEQLEQAGLSAADGARIDAIEGIAVENARFDAPSRLYTSLAFRLSVTAANALGEQRTIQAVAHVPTYGGIEQWYGLGINDADNETVWVSEADRSFEITFRRSGSGVGMSRRGAQVMARKGFSCAEILEFYYPGTALRTLALDDASGDGLTPRATPEPAAAVAEPIATARLSQKARLYRRADEASGALTTLPAGATVQVYAVQGDWAAIGSGGFYGFGRTGALAAFELAGAAATEVKNETIAQVSEAVGLMQLPVEGAKVLARLSAGDAVQLSAYTDAWAMVVTADGATGYIPRDALTLRAGEDDGGEVVTAPEDLYGMLTGAAGLYANTDESIPPRQTLAEGSYVRILAYNSAWAYVRTLDGDTGYMKLQGLSATQSPPDSGADIDGGQITVVRKKAWRYVSAETLPLYESYSADSRVLATLRQGDRVQLGAYNAKWACVRVDGVTGFVALDGLSGAAPGDIDGGEVTLVKGKQYATVVRQDAPLYASWSEADAPIARLKQGDRVQLGAYNGKWACVRVDGVTGFMLVEALEYGAGDAAGEDDGVNYIEFDAVAAADVALYAHASLEGEALVGIAAGARVHVYAYDSRRAYVEYGGQRGFVAVKHLKKAD